MNRIERLIWEETQLKEMENLRRDSPGVVSGKVIFLITIVLCLLVLVASRISMLTLDDAVVRALVPTSVFYTPDAASNPARKVGAAAGTSSPVTAGAAGRAAPRDDRSVAAIGPQR